MPEMMQYLPIIMPIAIALLSIVCMCLGWFASQIWTRLRINEDALSAHKLSVAENYVRHDRMQETLKPIAAGVADMQIMVGRLLQRDGK